MDKTLVGIVENEKFRLLWPGTEPPGGVRLTSISMQEARPPETGELNLSEYEGCAIAVQGHDGGGWIYQATVIDTGGPIVTTLVQQVFGQESGLESGGVE